MSLDLVPSGVIPFSRITDKRMRKYGIRVSIDSDGVKRLARGEHEVLYAYRDPDGSSFFARYGLADDEGICEALEREFGYAIITAEEAFNRGIL